MSNEKDYRDAGLRRSAYDDSKWINPTNGHWVKEHEGGSKTFSTSRHNTYGAGMSQKEVADRLKK